MIGDASAARKLRDRLTTVRGIGPVTASKLMAAKRPELIPVWDQHIEQALRPTKGQFWFEMQAAVADNQDRLRAIASDTGAVVPILRVADVVAWMSQHGKERLSGHRPDES